MEEFILRVGANWSAAKQELGRFSAYAKAWGTTLVDDFKSRLGRVLVGGFLLDKGMEFFTRTLENVREKVLAIKRAQEELPGVGSNFIQNTFNYLQRIGLNFEQASKPLLTFKQLLDAARLSPASDEMYKLERYGIVTSEADLKTQKFSASLAKLSEAYLNSGKNLKVLEDLMGKQAINPALLALLDLGPEKLRNLNRGNIFTDITGSNLQFFKSAFQGATGWQQVATATLGNLAGWWMRFDPVLRGYRTLKQAFTHPIDSLLHPAHARKVIAGQVEDEAAAAQEKLAETIDQEAKRVAFQKEFLDLKEKEKELTAVIADRGKESLEQVAAQAHRLSGIPVPRLYGLTARMRTAMNISDMEAQARLEWLKGNDARSTQLMDQAQKLRAASPWLTDKDREPYRKVMNDLDTIKLQLEPMKKMAELVTHDAKTPPAAASFGG